MSVNTSNILGKISISDNAISKVAGRAALECYGIVELVQKGLWDSIKRLFCKKGYAGAKIITVNDRISVELFVVVKYGVSINAVAQSLREVVKYKVENFTGMIVSAVNVNVLGVKL